MFITVKKMAESAMIEIWNFLKIELPCLTWGVMPVLQLFLEPICESERLFYWGQKENSKIEKEKFFTALSRKI